MNTSGINNSEALELLQSEGSSIYTLMSRANEVRIENKGYKVRLCGVVNAKSGHCSEDCKFCAQSAHNDAKIDCYSLLNPDKIVEAAHNSIEDKATRFGIVTSGLAIEEEDEVNSVAAAIERIAAGNEVMPCASLGNISDETMKRFKEAGLTRYHCNLETAQSFFSEICTTRAWSDSRDTILRAKAHGLATCCGGIFGLGESLEQRVEFLEQIRKLDVDSVPINFLSPVKGTALENISPISPLDCVKVIAVARLMMPDKEIRICGGREKNMRDLQSWALISGADGLMVGGYLTTAGRDVETDLSMIRDAGFEIYE
jgi:biotin synthase